ncbi:piezo-type mechanosensitive ion channel component 2-like [Tachypleus tridentatus]|uniref:piezo-type mechanosensitive ion channel component 2-like n=1 Tax=Tachypleus tridentatus TaxID=6853 RepID=UPI003FD2933E
MVNSLLCSCLFRVVLPLVLLIAVIFRFNFFSFLYLLLLLLAPIVPGPTLTSNGLGHISRYLKVILGLSTLSCLSHVVFQAVLLSLGDYGKFPVQCTRDGRLLALIGLHGFDGIQPLDALRLMGLDFVVLLTTVGVLVTSEKFSEVILSQEKEHSEKHKLFYRKKKRIPSEFLAVVRELVFLVLLAGAGILHPSLISSSYFLLFLSIATWLACNQKLGHTFILVRTVLAIYCASNIIVLYLYQLDYAQKLIHPKSKGARLLGLLGLVDSSCGTSGDSRTIIFRPEHWTVYIQPLVLLGLYWLLCFLIRYKLHADVGIFSVYVHVVQVQT